VLCRRGDATPSLVSLIRDAREMTDSAPGFTVFATAAGFCAIGWRESGIVRFQLPSATAEAARRLLGRRLPGAAEAPPPADVAAAIEAAVRYFAGEAVDFSDVRLDLAGQDPFFARVYAALRDVGWGRTTTYGTLARALGAGPEAARAVGQAMANNPVPLIIPCHRVLAAGGKVGGFSAPGGADSKIRMLALEGVDLTPPPPVQASLPF
jgi:methylated-DNA-[protein]-cysteine S-methyltransferase